MLTSAAKPEKIEAVRELPVRRESLPTATLRASIGLFNFEESQTRKLREIKNASLFVCFQK